MKDDTLTSMQFLLDRYAQELGVSLTMDILINSHRTLRNELKKPRKEWREELERAKQLAYSTAIENTWIKIDDLRKMTVEELVNKLE